MALEIEIETYQQRLTSLLAKDEGKFVLIHGNCVQVYREFNDALNAGFREYGEDEFLVRQILTEQPLEYAMRVACPI